MSIKVKVDEKSKSVQNVEEQKEPVKEAKSSPKKDEFKYIRKDKDERMFLLKETAEQLELMHDNRQKIESDLSLLLMKEGNIEKDKEILNLKIQILERDLRDVKTAKAIKIEDKRRENVKHAEYMEKIRKEVGHQTFGLSEEDEILIE